METQINSQNYKLHPRFFFLSLGLLITLITSVVSLLNLIFGTLDKKFPDVLNSSYQYGYMSYDYESIRGALATLIIFFPVFLIVAYFWKKFTYGEMGSIDTIIKKWVIYIILFLSALVLAIDLVILVRYFISGEITNRFIFKVVSAFVVAALVMKYYYVSEIWNRSQKLKNTLGIIYIAFSVVLVSFAIVYSFVVMGSPKTQRLLRLDDRRVNDLMNLQNQIINYWQQKEKLPENLKVLANPMTGYSLPVPPVFNEGENYEYNIKDEKKLSFELCATFAAEMQKGWRESGNGGISPMMARESNIAYPVGGINESWDHKIGRTCFERSIDKDIYPPISKIKN